MEKIPEQWTELRRKAGGDETPSLLDLIWEPGYEDAYQDFLDWVASATAGYLQGVGELKFVTHFPGSGFTTSVQGSAQKLQAQVRLAFSGIIKKAIDNRMSESALQNALWMQWVRMEGARHSEINSRLRVLSHSAMGWYANFLRRYLILAAAAKVIFATWHAYVRKAIAAGIYAFAVVLYKRFPKQTRVVGKALTPFKEFRDAWITRGSRIPGIVKAFVESIKASWRSGGPQGLVYSNALLESLKHGLPVIGPFFAGVMGGLLAVLLTNYRVDAPELESEEIDAIYGNPNWASYRQEVAKTASSVHDIETRIDALEAPSFDTQEGRESTIARLRVDVERLFLSQGNEYLSSVKNQLTERLDALSGHPLGSAVGPGVTYEFFKERTDTGIPDSVIDAYYDDMEILEVLAPQIEQLLGGRDPNQLSDEEVVQVIQQAADNSQPALEAYGKKLSERIYKEQTPTQEVDQAPIALEAAVEATQRLEDLIMIQSTAPAEYEQVIRQLEATIPELGTEEISTANEIISSTKDILAALEGE